MNKNAPAICLTGGPCSGKSSSREYLERHLKKLGYHLLFIPETPTMLMESGIHWKTHGATEFQRHVLEHALELERKFQRAAASVTWAKPVIISDRGIMDPRAYMPDASYWGILSEQGLDAAKVYARYDAVIHLRTAAFGAEEFYTRSNNKMRRESLRAARAADERTLAAWNGHPHLRVVGNDYRTFKGKLRRTLKHVTRALGVPSPLEIERKFLVQAPDPDSFPVHVVTSIIEQVYVLIPGHKRITRVRSRTTHGGTLFTHTVKGNKKGLARPETEAHIDESEFHRHSKHRVPNTATVKKKRYTFVWENQYFELDVFEEPHTGTAVLEIELLNENEPISLPPFINVIKEVSGMKQFSSSYLAGVRE